MLSGNTIRESLLTLGRRRRDPGYQHRGQHLRPDQYDCCFTGEIIGACNGIEGMMRENNIATEQCCICSIIIAIAIIIILNFFRTLSFAHELTYLLHREYLGRKYDHQQDGKAITHDYKGKENKP